MRRMLQRAELMSPRSRFLPTDGAQPGYAICRYPGFSAAAISASRKCGVIPTPGIRDLQLMI